MSGYVEWSMRLPCTDIESFATLECTILQGMEVNLKLSIDIEWGKAAAYLYPAGLHKEQVRQSTC